MRVQYVGGKWGPDFAEFFMKGTHETKHFCDIPNTPEAAAHVCPYRPHLLAAQMHGVLYILNSRASPQLRFVPVTKTTLAVNK